jgi:hypothetical protein
MSTPNGMFVALTRRNDGLWEAFIPAPPGAPNIVQSVRLPGLSLPAIQQTVDTGGAIALLIGAAAGVAGVPIDEFIKKLHLSNDAIRQARGIVDRPD